MPRVTLNTVNAAIRAAGGKEELVKPTSGDYFYFSAGDAARWRETGVYVTRLSDFTVEGWVKEWRRLRDENSDRTTP